MKVTDSHVHLWDRSVTSLTWMDGTGLPDRCLPDDLPPSAPFEREIVLVEVGSDPGSAVDEARWFSSLVQQVPEVVGFVANLPFTQNVDEALATLETLPGWRGVRWLMQDHAERLDDRRTHDALHLLAEAAVPFDLCVRHHELAAATALVSQHPRLTVVLDHCGKPPLAQPELLEAWAGQVSAFAALPNTVVKLSGLSAEAEGLPADEALLRHREVLVHCFDVFGPERCLTGSDWPISPLLDDRAAGWFDLVADVAGDDAEQVLTGTAARVYRERR